MDTAELLKKVRRIEIKTKGLSKHLFSGSYHSVFKGRGMSFSEVREYTPGDDVRHIDWNVTARAGQVHIKLYEEERELCLMLLVDISASVFFGSRGQSKSDWITEISAVLAFSAMQNQDKVGLILFSDKIHLYIPPKKGKQHILRIIRELLTIKSIPAQTHLEAPLQFLNSVLRKKCISFILSDFHCSIPGTALKVASKRHDIIGLQILDPLEKSFEAVGLIALKDAETGQEIILDSQDREIMERYYNDQSFHNKMMAQSFKRAKSDFIEMDLNDSYLKVLLKFFKARKHL
ncbi:MAG: DUF58 domain-containing protein [Bacteroidota bacterium]|nr:DUF58 domain-containing protein [Bacteroidota bacterium]